MSSKYPEVRLGDWMYDSVNYICLTPNRTPQEYIVKNHFALHLKKMRLFLKLIQLQEVWKEDGTNCYNQLYLVQDKIGQIGTNIMYIKKRDKKRRVTKFIGNFVQSGFIPSTGKDLFHIVKQKLQKYKSLCDLYLYGSSMWNCKCVLVKRFLVYFLIKFSTNIFNYSRWNFIQSYKIFSFTWNICKYFIFFPNSKF